MHYYSSFPIGRCPSLCAPQLTMNTENHKMSGGVHKAGETFAVQIKGRLTKATHIEQLLPRSFLCLSLYSHLIRPYSFSPAYFPILRQNPSLHGTGTKLISGRGPLLGSFKTNDKNTPTNRPNPSRELTPASLRAMR
ncbi:unnamed protein product [Lactuca saligna]|uniref:Uncharacterized protein n=1 Tax=Lactuca saligna TaxID=75948 RepID=A0AA35YAY2_LACSI|nr:unnamed protein product [Lactuca saligna]